MKITAPQSVLENLEGATIVSSFIEDEDGLHICFADGRVLIIAGMFTLGLVRLSEERLH